MLREMQFAIDLDMPEGLKERAEPQLNDSRRVGTHQEEELEIREESVHDLQSEGFDF